jgi:alpha-tubulin suppressor-like RCC1 family protein
MKSSVKNLASVLVAAAPSLILFPTMSHAGGQVVAWGDNTYGQTNVPLCLTNVVAIAGGGYHSLALKADGTVVGWSNFNTHTNIERGQTNYGYFPPNYGQAIIPANLTNVMAIAAGGYHSVALKTDGSVVAWGAGTNNTGISPNYGQSIVPPGCTNVVAIAAGRSHSLALKRDGKVLAWGLNASGQTNVPAGLSNIVAIGAGWYHSLALRIDGSVVAWGWNDYGQTNTTGLSNIIVVAGGGEHSLVAKADGSVVAWGDNFESELNVPGGLSNVVAIAAQYYSLALKAGGTVVAWGYNNYGQTNVPPGLAHVLAIGAGWHHSLALVGDGLPALHATLSNPTWSADGFSVELPTQSGRVYALEYKNSVTDNNWTALPLVAGNGGVRTLTDPTAASSRRFYRVRQW